jgi:hypothetical protein
LAAIFSSDGTAGLRLSSQKLGVAPPLPADVPTASWACPRGEEILHDAVFERRASEIDNANPSAHHHEKA